jgi:AcrR family transcriptional regulator
MPRTTAAVAAETSRRVLDTARAVFAAEGFAAASLDDIARRAGVTRGAVYHHYDGKAGLFRAVAEVAQAEVAGRIVAAAEANADPVAQLRAGCHGFLDAITDGDTARLLLVEAPAALGWEAWRELDAAAGARELREALDTADVADAEATAHLLNGAMNEAALWLVERPGDEAARTAAHTALDRLLDAVVA